MPSLAPKPDKNRTLPCTSINLRYSLCYYTIWGIIAFFILYEQVMPLIIELKQLY